MIGLDRRTILKVGFLGAASALLPAGARGAEIESHGLSTFGDLKYPPDVRAFDYVHPDAPKGGVFSQQLTQTIYNQNLSTFDSLHIFILKGTGAAGMEKCFATLLARAYDEPDAMYGYAAQSVTVSADRQTYRFRLRPGLTFHDGSPLTAEDCAWSFNTLKAQGHPYISVPLQSFIEAVAEAPDLVRVTLAAQRGRNLPLVIANLPIFSKAWWANRDFSKSSLDAPLGSGPYKVAKVDAGQTIGFERVKDWWGEKLPSQIGRSNFDSLSYVYYRDRATAFLGFSTRNFLFHEEFASAVWATGYDIPPVRDGRIKRETLPDHTPSGAQGWNFNCRRSKFADPRVRQALGMAFDFEWTNKTVMFGSYDRVTSMFENSPLKATGTPGPEELAILEPFRGKVPDAVFGEAILPPVSDGSGADRAMLQGARKMLAEAGWTIDNRVLKNAKGEAFTIEFLDDSDALYKHTAPLIQSLGRLGIAANFRVVDSSQLQARTNSFDFDIIIRRISFDQTPGEGLRGFFSSKNANQPGSLNCNGIADPVVDELIERIIAAQSRPEVTTLCRVLDRVLRAGYYWIPQWYKATHWLAYWDQFAHRDSGVIYELGAPELWWAK